MSNIRASIGSGIAAILSATVCVAAPITSSATPTAAPSSSAPPPTHWVAKAGAPASVQKFVTTIPQAKAAYISSATKNITELKLQKDALDSTQTTAANTAQQEAQLAAEERRMRSRLLAARIRAETDEIYQASVNPMWLPPEDAVLQTRMGSIGHIHGKFRVMRILDARQFIALLEDAAAGNPNGVFFWVNGVDTRSLVENAIYDSGNIWNGMFRVDGTRVYGSPLDPARTVDEIEPFDFRSNVVAVSDDFVRFSSVAPVANMPAVPFTHTPAGIAALNKLNQAHALVAGAQSAAALAFDRTPQGVALTKAVNDADAQRQATSGQEKLDASHAFVSAKSKLDDAEQVAVRDDANVNVAIAMVISASSEQAAAADAYLHGSVP